MKRIFTRITALALAGAMVITPALAAQSFTDVPESHWGHSFVSRAAEEKLVSGMDDGTFGVNGPLSNAQFVTMICNLLYRSEVDAYYETYKPKEWWRSFMAVAYTKGLLDNTVVGTSRATNNSWKTSVVNGEISRYDMAQIMVNVAQAQKWEGITDQQAQQAQGKIADWKEVPARYQSAVSTAYAKSWLSGMDAQGTFAGEQSMTRLHGAVVICKLLDAKDSNAQIKAPEYTNTKRLVNGQKPTQENVTEALELLQAQYPSGYIFSPTATYRSAVLGSGEGAEALMYLLSDQVFGAFASEQVENRAVKAGDLIWLHKEEGYILVTEVAKDVAAYVACSSTGRVSWGNMLMLKDLNKLDKVYSRYPGEEPVLTNGEAVSSENVYELLLELSEKKLYREFREWDMEQRHDTWLMGKCRGSEAFAAVLSDEVFGNLDGRELDDVDDILSGDVIYLERDDAYGIVVEVYTRSGKDYIEYATVDGDGEISWQTRIAAEDLDLEDDRIYSRYPE